MALQLGSLTFSLDTLASRIRQGGNIARTLLANAGIDRRYHKYFAIGYHKTATTSLDAVFRQAGLLSAHTTSWRSKTLRLEHYAYQAFSDGPPDDFTVFDRHFKGAKFILNTRDLYEWLESRVEHFRYLEGRNITSRSAYAGTDATAVKNWLRERNRLHLQILEHFKHRPDDLLIVNFIRDPDAAAKLASFVGSKKPVVKPYARTVPKVREAGDNKNRAMIETCFAELGIPQDEWNNDIYCPSLEDAQIRQRWAGDTADTARGQTRARPL